MWKRRNRELATLAQRCLKPLTLAEWLALCVAGGAALTIVDQPVEHGSPPVNIVHDNAVYIGEGSVSWAGTTPTGTSGTTYYFNQSDKWLDCSMARETSQCVPRDFPKP
jgi:hypothetical protein